MWSRRKQQSILPELLFSKFFLIFCVVMFLAILFGLAKGTVKNYRVDSEILNLQEEINRLDGQNKEYGQIISYLKSDDFIEQEGKLKLGLKKIGENLVIIPEDKLEVAPAETAELNTNLTNPAKWWVYFFNDENQ